MNDAVGSSNYGYPRDGQTLARLVENSPFGIYIIDADFRIALLSAGARAAFAGIHPLVGRDLSEVLHIIWPEPFASEVIGRFQHTLETGEPFHSAETTERRRNVDAVESYDWQVERLPLPDGRFGVVCHFYDNTNRMRAVASLRESEARLTAALNGSPAFMGIVRGRQHIYEFVNDAVYELVGRRPLIGKPVAEAIPEIVGQGYIEMLDGVYSTGEPFIGKNVPAMFARTTGGSPEQRYLDFAYQPLRTPDGAIDGVFFHGVDVTDRLRDERRLHLSEQRYRALVMASSEVSYGMSADWSTMLPLDGRGLVTSNAEPMRDWMERNIPLDEHGLVRAEIEKAIAGRKLFALEHRVIRPDGSLGWTFSRAVPVFDESGHLVEWFGTASDITDRKRAEASLRESEERFRHAAYAASDILWTNTSDGKMRGEQPGWSAFTGQSREEYQDYGWATAVHPDDAEPTLVAWEAAVRARTNFVFEHRLRRHDGEYRICAIRAVPVLSDDGVIREWVGVHTDVTEKRRDEEVREKLLQSERATRIEAEQAGRMKDEFLATLSHEIRTPLNAILGWSQIMRSSNDPEDLATGLEVIERNARSQTQIIEDLLDMSRIISGKVRLDVQSVDLPAIVQAAIETARPTAEAKGVALRAVIDPLHQVAVSGDVNRLQQILWNLISNAVKFTPRAGSVQVVLERVDSHLEICVIDTGEGIDPAFLPFVFDRFRQADATTTRRHGGLGLGLSIVKQLVELHGGGVRAKSEGRGLGSSFIVSLPLTPLRTNAGDEPKRRRPQVEFTAPTSLEACHNIEGVRLLVVDDEPDARQIVRRILEECKAIVTTASSADEAIALLQGAHFDVLISDIGMPEQDGFGLIKRVRAMDAEIRSIPAIALTAYVRAADREKTVSAGFLTHVAKPVEPIQLITSVAAAAGRTVRSDR